MKAWTRLAEWCVAALLAAGSVAAWPQPSDSASQAVRASAEELTINFALGRFSLSAADRSRIKTFCQRIGIASPVAVSVVGYADQSGADEKNLELSRRRAKAVADEVLRDGVNPALLQVDWKGEFSPAFPNEDKPEPRNRRVVIRLIL